MKKRLMILALAGAILVGSVPALAQGPRCKRLNGDNRYQTSVAISKEAFDQSETAILASGESYPDALSAVGLAAKIESPILLSAKTNLDKGVETFLEDKELIYLVGGPNTLSKSMENLLNGEKPADEKPADENPEEEKPIEKPEKEKPTAEEVREELSGLINDERQRVGRQALGQGPYQDLADQRAEEIVKKLSHTRPDGSKATTKLLIENDYFVAAENIVMGYSAQNMFNAWKGSPGHYNNMINEEFKRSCIGIFEYDGYYYGVQLFTD